MDGLVGVIPTHSLPIAPARQTEPNDLMPASAPGDPHEGKERVPGDRTDPSALGRKFGVVAFADRWGPFGMFIEGIPNPSSLSI